MAQQTEADVSHGSQKWGNRALSFLPLTIATVVIAATLSPRYWLVDEFPWRGDSSGHPVIPWVLAERMLPAGSLGGWSEVMYAGIPVNGLYPPLGALLIAIASYIVPLAVAYKVFMVLPIVLLPAAAFFASSMARLPVPYAAMSAVAVVPFAMDTACGSCGATVLSTSLGEFAYGWGTLLAVVSLGFLDRLGRTGRGAALTAIVLTLGMLGHPIPGLWLAAAAVVLLALHQPWTDRRRLVSAIATLLVAGGLAAIWWIPFLSGRDWMPNNGVPGLTDKLPALFPASTLTSAAVALFALSGTVLAIRLRQRLLMALSIMTGLTMLAILALPSDAPFDSQRLIPLWSLGLWWLAGAGLAGIVRAACEAGRIPSKANEWAPVTAVAIVSIVVAGSWGWIGVVKAPEVDQGNGQGSLLGIGFPITEASAFAKATMAGMSPREDYPDFQDMVGTLKLAASQGDCGRLAWDIGLNDSPQGGPFGDELTFWKAPIWTDGCLNPISGILQDSSSTALDVWSAHALTSNGSPPIFSFLPSQSFDWTAGKPRLEALGVQYYLTHGGDVAKAVRAAGDAKVIAAQGRWELWKLSTSDVVIGLRNLPIVASRLNATDEFALLGQLYRRSPDSLTTPLVSDGPSAWPRSDLTGGLPVTPINEPARVTALDKRNDSLTFTVEKTGEPVLIRMSAYPGWTVTGAEGPYRATPNFLVVVPTETEVTLTRTRTLADWLGLTLGLVAALGLLWLVVREPRLGRRLSGDLDAPPAPSAPGTP